MASKGSHNPKHGGSDDERSRDVRKMQSLFAAERSAPPLRAYEALGRLVQVARQDSGKACRVANFLVAWHTAEESGGGDPVDLWSVDAAIADDMLLVLQLIRESHRYPGDLGFQPEVEAIRRIWRRK